MNTRSVGALPSRPSPGAAGTRLAELYEAHARMVYGVSRLLLRNADEAEDATQQVFLLAYRSLLTGTEVRAPSAWLGTIARNECRTRIQTRSRQPRALADEPTLVGPGPDELASKSAEIAALYTELAALPEKQREAVVLRDVYGLRYAEVAAALDTSLPAVESLLFRGRRRLQRRLRPGFAAGVIAVPLAVHESLAYAVPGFAGAAGTGAAVQVGLLAKLGAAPALAKLAAAGAAVGVAGSAGLVAERELRDPPRRPAAAIVRVAPSPQQPGPLRSLVPGRTAAVRASPPGRVADRSGRDEQGGPNGDAAGRAGPSASGDDQHVADAQRGANEQGGVDEQSGKDGSDTKDAVRAEGRDNGRVGQEEHDEPEPTSRGSDSDAGPAESSDSDSAGSDAGLDSSGSDEVDSGSPEPSSDDGDVEN